MRWVAVLFGLALSVSMPVVAVQPTLDRRALEEAVYVGQSRIEIERTRFHGPYRISVASPPVDWIDVVTPFHRVELAAEQAARAGRRMFGQREALAVLAAAPDQLDLLVEMTFHPLNTFVGIPSYEVVIAKAGGDRLAARRIDRYPRFGPRPESTGPALPDPSVTPVLGTGQPILGGMMVAVFDLSRLSTTERQFIIVLDGTKELARAGLDLARMR